MLVIYKCKAALKYLLTEGSLDNSLLQPEIDITPISFHNYYFVNSVKKSQYAYTAFTKSVQFQWNYYKHV